MSALGPIAELRHSFRSPAALAVGAAIGGAAPLTNYFTVHCGHLVWFERDNIHFAGWSPLWILVAGSFGLSSKSVFLWGRNTFGDGWSAAALVAMLEGALLLAPVEEIGLSALVFLVLLNAAAYGSVLALRDQADKAREATEKLAVQPPPAAAALVTAAAIRRGGRHTDKPARQPVALVPTGPSEPKQDDEDDPDRDLYARAIDFAKKCTSLSTETLRRGIGIRQPTAAVLITQLERNGIIGPIDPSDRGRRPVLLRAESA